MFEHLIQLIDTIFGRRKKNLLSEFNQYLRVLRFQKMDWTEIFLKNSTVHRHFGLVTFDTYLLSGQENNKIRLSKKKALSYLHH